MTIRTFLTVAVTAGVLSALPFTINGTSSWVQPNLAMADDDNEGGNWGGQNRENGNRGNWNQGNNQGESRGNCAGNRNCENNRQNQYRNQNRDRNQWGGNGNNRGGRDGDDD